LFRLEVLLFGAVVYARSRLAQTKVRYWSHT